MPTPNKRRSNLLPRTDAVVGRDELVGRVLEALDRGDRLLTVTGAAGVGKSRLASQVALASMAADEQLDVWCLDTGSCADLAKLWDTGCETLQIPGDAADPPLRMARALTARGRSLVVLDDFDGLVATAAEPLARLVAQTPETSWLVTSRQRLGMPEEVVFDLPPLGLDPATPGASLGDAAQLLLDLAAKRGATIGPDDMPFLDALARELDGIPLAIQLAAARLTVMSPRVLLHRLRANRSVLERSGRAAGSKHASLDAAIEGSWNALLPHEREALAQCTVFRGSFDLAAAEAVIDLSASPDCPVILDAVQTLRDRSMIRTVPGAPGSGGVRLALYRSIQSFAAARLDPADAHAARTRHADYYVALGESNPDLLRRRELVLLEHDNLLAIVERTLAHGPVTARRAEPALRALLLLSPGLVASRPVHALLRSIGPVIDVTRDSGADPLLYD